MKDKILKIVVQYRMIIISLLLLLLFGYSLWQIQAISSPKLDSAYLSSRRSAATDIRLHIKDEVKAQIEDLKRIPVSTKPGRLGTNDPFNP